MCRFDRFSFNFAQSVNAIVRNCYQNQRIRSLYEHYTRKIIMLRKSIALLVGIATAFTTVQPTIARPMTRSETAYLTRFTRLPEYRAIIAEGTPKQAAIDMGWKWCRFDTDQTLVQLIIISDPRTSTISERDRTISMIGGALAIENLCPENRSTYGKALDLWPAPVELRRSLWEIAR
jgi:hypothetical protein